MIKKFFSWLHFSWDFRIGWDGPYCEIRAVGFRITGIEFEHFEFAWTEDEEERRKVIPKDEYNFAINLYLKRKENQ